MRAPVELMSDAHLSEIKRRAEDRFRVIDNLSPEVRAIVHEYGWAAVKCLMDLGVTTPLRLRHAIKTIRGERF